MRVCIMNSYCPFHIRQATSELANNTEVFKRASLRNKQSLMTIWKVHLLQKLHSPEKEQQQTLLTKLFFTPIAPAGKGGGLQATPKKKAGNHRRPRSLFRSGSGKEKEISCQNQFHLRFPPVWYNSSYILLLLENENTQRLPWMKLELKQPIPFPWNFSVLVPFSCIMTSRLWTSRSQRTWLLGRTQAFIAILSTAYSKLTPPLTYSQVSGYTALKPLRTRKKQPLYWKSPCKTRRIKHNH